jgi:2-C-methyl-D-erythritol 2,4-cyclodiphosphate synthase
MLVKIAETLKISMELISIKAKTNEGMGFAGRQEGIAAYAVVTIVKKGDK